MAEVKFIEEWTDRWRALFDLLFETIRTDQPHTKSQLDELRYENLSSWFIDNEPQFLPLWKNFAQSQDWSLDINENLIQQIHEGEQALDNPFRAFYSTGRLDDLLHYIAGSEDCYPTEKQAWDTAVAMFNVSSLAAQFVLSMYS